MKEADVTLRVSDSIEKGRFTLGKRLEGDRVEIKYDGKIEDLADSFISVGIIRSMTVQGDSIFIVINEADLDKFIGSE